MPVVTFLPDQKSVTVDPEVTILQAAGEAGLEIPASCGGKGLCGKCRVRVVEGDSDAHVGHEHALSPAELAAGWRLACLAPVSEDLTVEVPSAPTKTSILTDFGETDVEPDAAVQVLAAEMAAPSLEDQASDMERLGRALGRPISPHSSLAVIRSLPPVLRACDFRVHAVMKEDELLDVTPMDAGPPPPLGLAVDVGTTTVAGVLVDLLTGENLAVASRTNPQAVHGDDVVTRIEFAAENAAHLAEMQELIAGAVNEIARETTEAAGASVRSIYEIAAAGNTTMHHLLLGLPPEHIGVTPFVAVRRHGIAIRARRLGIETAAGGRLYAVPNVSGYVGGDITAGLQAHDVHQRAENLLYIDIGTNGEMALRARGTTYACSTAAGPAFEGARISCGMRAATGAVSRVEAGEEDLRITTIGDAPARGICGTGLLDAVATLLDLGVVDETGRFLDLDEMPADLPPAVRERLDTSGEEAAYVLAEPACGTCPRVTVTGRDIRELQLAKGAVAAGFRTLLQYAELAEEELDGVLLAGAFGSFMRPESARRIGLLPQGCPLPKVSFVGNAALAGARAILLNRLERRGCEALAREVEYIELSGRADFQELFMETMMFPLTTG
jgi:uncharacterized 2Fe-2S/4Fe-4S cluster protein (DUF4445 family)